MVNKSRHETHACAHHSLRHLPPQDVQRGKRNRNRVPFSIFGGTTTPRVPLRNFAHVETLARERYCLNLSKGSREVSKEISALKWRQGQLTINESPTQMYRFSAVLQLDFKAKIVIPHGRGRYNMYPGSVLHDNSHAKHARDRCHNEFSRAEL